MPRLLLRTVMAAIVAVCAVAPVICESQARHESPGDALLGLLVFGTDQPVDAKAYPPVIRDELNRYLQRYQAYHSDRVRPVIPGTNRGLDGMVYAAWVREERMLAAVSPEPAAPALARAYVDRLRPCYEWEGFHDCPEREAKFASDYQTANPNGPFREYLPLLAAHRWLCAAEGYEYEKQPEGVQRSRRAYEEEISKARRSSSALIRFAAGRLADRNTCFPRP